MGRVAGRENGHYLIEDYAVGTATYGQQLYGLLSDKSVSGKRLALIGGVDYDQRREQSTPSAPATPT